MKEQGRLTRRRFVAAASVGGLSTVVGGQYFDQGTPEQFRYVDEEQFREGFSPIEPKHPIWSDLTTPEKRSELEYKNTQIHGHSDAFKKEYYFSIDEENTPVEVKLAVGPTSNVKARPFVATLENGTKLFLPFVQSVRPSSVTAYLGRLGKGPHALQLNEVPFPLDPPLDAEVFVGLTSVSGTPLQNYLRDTQPRYGIRADNLEDMTNDMPLFETTEVLENANEIILKKTVIYTSEDGGLSPVDRLRRYGRTEDVEPSVHQKVKMRRLIGFPGQDVIYLPDEKQAYNAIVQVPGQKTPHAWAKFEGKQTHDGQPLLQIKTDNNLLSEREVTGILYAPVPMYGLGENTANKLLRANPEWQIIGFKEEARAIFFRTLPQAGHLAEVDLNALEHYPYGSYPTTDVLAA